jgi:S-adenosylmethionine-diacylglycerol 3-amino-3-carboxypropyl transferase
MAHVVHDRLRRLACDFDLATNYFAWQAFGRRYDTEARQAVPRYLQQEHYAHLRDRIDNVVIHRKIATTFMAEQPKASIDAFVLLDAQDWMNDQQLNALRGRRGGEASPQALFKLATALHRRRASRDDLEQAEQLYEPLMAPDGLC